MGLCIFVLMVLFTKLLLVTQFVVSFSCLDRRSLVSCQLRPRGRLPGMWSRPDAVVF